MSRMPCASYDAMKARLRELLSEWGMWSSAELERVASFVEREAVLYAAQSQMKTDAEEQPPQAAPPKAKKR